MQPNDTSARIARLCMVIICFGVGQFVAIASAQTMICPGNITPTAAGTGSEHDINSIDDPDDLTGLKHTFDAWPWYTPATWVDSPPAGGKAHASLPSGVTWIKFAFDQAYDIQTVRIWNTAIWHPGEKVMVRHKQGFKSTFIHYSSDGTDWTELSHAVLAEAPTKYDTAGYLPQLELDTGAGGIRARYVAITAQSTYWGDYGNGAAGYAGLAHVQFELVPEPAGTAAIIPDASAAAPAAAKETEILKTRVGCPTFLTPTRYQSTASVAVSRTGTVAAFYPRDGVGGFYRISKDGGQFWGQERAFPPGYPSSMCVGRREGGVLFMLDTVAGSEPGQLQAERIVFSDDFLKYEVAKSAVSLPNVVMHTKWTKRWPGFRIGKIVQLDNGDLLGTMHGNLKGDNNWYRTIVLRSTDQGDSWQYHATVAFSPDDPDPNLVGSYCGYCEPSIALLTNGQLLCIMRTQGAQYAGEYRPYYQSWSDDLGKTWTRPVPTRPHLMSNAPTLAVLDNGVVVCRYGRPGFHIAFSLDHGHTWQDQIRFSDLPEPVITGEQDIVKVGPNRFVAIGSDATGTKVWPISVRRVKVPQTHALLEGRVLDPQGDPIAGATVERSPNRYYLDAWLEHETEMDPWKATPLTVGSPHLGYRSIRKENRHPVVKTDARGRFQFDPVKLGEYVLTVEGDGFAPQSRNIKVSPQVQSERFDLKPGRKVSNRVLDAAGRPVAGACVVLNRRHVHTDAGGYFHWSLEEPVPQEVTLKVYMRYRGDYETLDTTVTLSQLESQPITLKNR